MAVPFVRNAVKGWTKKYTVKVLRHAVVNHEQVDTPDFLTVWGNLQFLKPQQVARKPEEQRAWSWVSLIVVKGPVLHIDDILVFGNLEFRVDNRSDWEDSGFWKYELYQGFKK